MPLSELGHRQAEWLLGAMPWESELIVHSRLPRSIETARYLFAGRPDVGVEEWPVHEFMPVPAAGVRGASLSDTSDQWAAYWDRSDPEHVEAEGGESFAELCERVRECFDRIASHPAQSIAIVSHGRFIRVIRASLDLGGFHDLPALMRRSSELANLPNAAILELRLDADGRPVACDILRQDSPSS